MAKALHNLTFYRSTPSHGAQYSDQRESSTTVNFANTILPRSQPSNNGYQGNNSSSGHYGARGRGGAHGGRYQDGEMSAARQLRQQISQNHGYGHGQGRHRDVPVFTASAAAAAVQLQQHLPPSDRQEFNEPSTIIWCEGGIGEVMSPSVWRNQNLHLYFDASRTVLEGPGGWDGLKTELEAGVEMDITFSISNGLLEQLRAMQMETTSSSADTHTFIRIATIAELRASRYASVRTHEQAVVIAKRSGGATFLINNSGERAVLHPAFMPSDGVRHAILEKTHGMKTIETREFDDSHSTLCVLGRSLAVRLAPAPQWLPTIYPTDHGVTRWALSAEAYGEEKRGRAVVKHSTCHAVILVPVEGDLVGIKTTLHAPIIQMQGQIKQEVQQIGSCWRFRACRELPGRMAVWRAFEIMEELDTDVPIAEKVVDSVLTGNRLIELEPEEEYWVDPLEEARRREGERKERRVVEERKVSSVLDDLAELQFAFTQPAAAASQSATAAWGGHDDQPLVCLSDNVVSSSPDVLVFSPIDDLLDSETFAADVFRAPTILPDEHLLLGVPPEEAIKTEQEMLLANPPRTTAVERKWGVYETGDERPDMRVRPKMKKKKKSRSRVDSIASSNDEDERKMEKKVASPILVDTTGDSQLRVEEKESTESDAHSTERRREIKEDSRLKKHLASINVGFVTSGSDMFDILQGGDESMESESAVPAATAAPPPVAVATTAAAPPSPTITFEASGCDMVDLLHGPDAAAPPAASEADAPSRRAHDTRARLFGELMKKKEQKPAVQPAAAAAAVADDLRNLTVAATPAPKAATAPAPTQTGPCDERFWAAWSEDPTGPPAPRFAILPYPERPRFEGGWWFRPSRARPEPVESRKEARKKRREAEERWRAEQMVDDADAASRRPDDTRERLLAEMMRKKAMKSVESPPVSAFNVEKKKDVVVERTKEEEEDAASAPVAYSGSSRAPADDVRARLLGALAKKKQKPFEPAAVVEEKKEKDADVENVLVDLSPSSDSPSPSLFAAAAASPTPLLQSPTDLLHDDLKDLF
ncbi:hypothetical protein PRIPAC_70127 [Pristionchus pacificus]|uniref:Uncharacterized protein n=1 Tax=Pristionchus pacificus TaxID=54126 RepID=A0A2A6B542_PRIPA|nr:hypothetical protein PRIPAC_70127 [Pristionchus pacificus]|eukprot:PDM60996.1 hypothetical protein PRIPAC_54802 [Pristionchus pacificus]